MLAARGERGFKRQPSTSSYQKLNICAAEGGYCVCANMISASVVVYQRPIFVPGAVNVCQCLNGMDGSCVRSMHRASQLIALWPQTRCTGGLTRHDVRSGTFLMVDMSMRLAWVQYMHLVVKYSVLRTGLPALSHGYWNKTERRMGDCRVQCYKKTGKNVDNEGHTLSWLGGVQRKTSRPSSIIIDHQH